MSLILSTFFSLFPYSFFFCKIVNAVEMLLIKLLLIVASASADASGDESAAKYSEMSAISWVLGHIWPQYPSLWPPQNLINKNNNNNYDNNDSNNNYNNDNNKDNDNNKQEHGST